MPQIRPAEPADADAISRIHRAAIREHGPEAYSDREVAAWLAPEEDSEGPDLQDPEKHWIVATVPVERVRAGTGTPEVQVGPDRNPDDHRAVGFGTLDVTEGEITAVYVHPAAQRRGVGAALLEALEAEARSRDIDSLRLWSSLNAAGFYDRRGYRRIEETTHETTGGVELDVIAFEKEL